jgi:hypothetical protein
MFVYNLSHSDCNGAARVAVWQVGGGSNVQQVNSDGDAVFSPWVAILLNIHQLFC